MDKDIQIVLNAFPKELEGEIQSMFRLISLKTKLYFDGEFDISIHDELIHIPYRVYYEDLADERGKLSAMQKRIIDCFYTRHNDGYIRQRSLRSLLENDVIDHWVMPYVLQLAGEYVEGILRDIYENIEKFDEVFLREFIRDNQSFINLTESRIISYWNEYHRSKYSRQDYVGFKLMSYIQTLK